MSAASLPVARLHAGYLVAVAVVAAATPTPRPTARPATTAPAASSTEPADIAASMSGGTILFIIVAAIVIGYFASLRLHPFSKCPRCKGKGIHRGSMYTFATRACTKCGGKGIRPRLGRRVFMSDKR